MTDQSNDPDAARGARPANRATASKQRKARRKGALLANMARRKAQVRGRQNAGAPLPDSDGQPGSNTEKE